MNADKINEIEERLKAIEDYLDEQKAKKSDDEDEIPGDEAEEESKSEDCEDEEKEGCESDDEEEQKSLLESLHRLTATISYKG